MIILPICATLGVSWYRWSGWCTRMLGRGPYDPPGCGELVLRGRFPGGSAIRSGRPSAFRQPLTKCRLAASAGGASRVLAWNYGPGARGSSLLRIQRRRRKARLHDSVLLKTITIRRLTPANNGMPTNTVARISPSAECTRSAAHAPAIPPDPRPKPSTRPAMLALFRPSPLPGVGLC
jgi:hypothetical protein